MPGSAHPAVAGKPPCMEHAMQKLKYFVSHKSSCEPELLGGTSAFPGKYGQLWAVSETARGVKVIQTMGLCGMWKYSHR